MYETIHGLRSFTHLNVLFIHYIGLDLKDSPYVDTEKWPIALIHSFQNYQLFCLCIIFVLTGINNGKWLTKYNRRCTSYVKLFMIYYWERLILIVPITYIYFAIYSFTTIVILKHPLITAKIKQCLIPNLLFIANIKSIECNVSLL